MKIALEVLSADKRRRKREIVKTFDVGSSHKDASEFEAVEELQQARIEADTTACELEMAKANDFRAQTRLVEARRNVRRVSER